MPKVSVIIPNYNHALYLSQRIKSILDQTYQDFELIILDDCSTDNSAELISQYQTHPKISKIIFNKTNSGSTFKQWQKGIREAQGEYIWIAESDDFAHELFLATLVRQLETHPQAGITYSQSYRADENSYIICSCKEIYPGIACGKVHTGKDVLLHHMAGANLIPNASAVVFRKSIASQIDTRYTQFKFSGDWWFWCEILLRSDIIHVCEELNYFRYHSNKVTVSSAKNGLYFIEGLQILELLRQKACLPRSVYYNKSKNYAKAFVFPHNDDVHLPSMSKSAVINILWQGLKLNRIFTKRAFILFLQKKLFKLRMIL